MAINYAGGQFDVVVIGAGHAGVKQLWLLHEWDLIL